MCIWDGLVVIFCGAVLNIFGYILALVEFYIKNGTTKKEEKENKKHDKGNKGKNHESIN